MRKVKEVLRLRFELGFGQRQIARSCGMGLSTVHEYLERAVAAGVGWPLPEGLGEEALEAKLFGHQSVPVRAVRERPQPDWKSIHEQLQQHSHLTLQFLWEEYRQAIPRDCRRSVSLWLGVAQQSLGDLDPLLLKRSSADRFSRRTRRRIFSSVGTAMVGFM